MWWPTAPSILSIRMRMDIPVASTVSCRKRTSIWMIEGEQPAPGWVNSADAHGPRRPDAAGRVFSAAPQAAAEARTTDDGRITVCQKTPEVSSRQRGQAGTQQ